MKPNSILIVTWKGLKLATWSTSLESFLFKKPTWSLHCSTAKFENTKIRCKRPAEILKPQKCGFGGFDDNSELIIQIFRFRVLRCGVLISTRSCLIWVKIAFEKSKAPTSFKASRERINFKDTFFKNYKYDETSFNFEESSRPASLCFAW